MRVVELRDFGGPENFADAERPSRGCGPAEVRIEVKAVSFSPIDYQLRQRPYGKAVLPLVLGFDVAGIITEAGEAVGDLRPGDAVIAYLGGPSMAGGYASEVVVPRSLVAGKPRNLDFAAAAAIPLTGLTALQCLRRTHITPQQSLLVTGAAGGAGSWVVRVAQALGVTRISATAGRAESRLYLEQEVGLSVDRLIDHHGATRAKLAVRACTANGGASYDVAIDCFGGAMTHLCCDTIGFAGQVVSIVNGADASVEETLFDQSATYHSELVYAAAETGDPAHMAIYARQLAELCALIESGKLQLPRIANLGLLSAATVANAHRQLADGRTIGKLVAVLPKYCRGLNHHPGGRRRRWYRRIASPRGRRPWRRIQPGRHSGRRECRRPFGRHIRETTPSALRCGGIEECVRSVAKAPGPAVLTVTPCPANSSRAISASHSVRPGGRWNRSGPGSVPARWSRRWR